MTRLLLFGAGGTSDRVREEYGDGTEWVCYIDNNPSLWGTEKKGLLIFPPSKIVSLQYDGIVIAMLKGVETVRNQLLSLGVAEEKITVPITHPALFPNTSVEFQLPYLPFREVSALPKALMLMYLIAKSVLLEEHYNNYIARLTRLLDCVTIKSSAEFIDYLHALFKGRLPEPDAIKEAVVDYHHTILHSQSFPLPEAFSDSEIQLDMMYAATELLSCLKLVVLSGGDLPQLLQASAATFRSQIVAGYVTSTKPFVSSSASLFGDSAVLGAQLAVLLVDETCDFPDLRWAKFIVAQTTTGEAEFWKLSHALLNPASFCFYLSRVEFDDNGHFESMLQELLHVLNRCNVPLEHIAITSGAILRAYGLQETDDIDIIMSSPLRDLYGKGLVVISDRTEMHPKDELAITDDSLLYHHRNCFLYQGVRFIRLELLARQRGYDLSTLPIQLLSLEHEDSSSTLAQRLIWV